eukprot:maker-scaffold_1-snap-gene-22.64-mRNA-1 protein AED:0.00 eAED:0.00 QI:81/1/1/1/1/1/2/112/425
MKKISRQEASNYITCFLVLSILYFWLPTYPQTDFTPKQVVQEDIGIDQLRSLNVRGTSNGIALKPLEEIYPVYEKKINREEEEGITPEQLPSPKKSAEEVQTDLEESEKAVEEIDFASFEKEVETLLDEDIFQDTAELEAAPFIKVLPESKRIQYRLIVLQHERFYRDNPSKLFVPHLKKTTRLSQKEFSELFMERSQPVIIPFEAMRHLNFTTQARTFPELLQMYPNRKPTMYKYGAVNEKEEIDLGPAIAVLAKDTDLKKTKKGRNFPRNMKASPSSVGQLGIDYPPFVPEGTKMQAPSVWFGATTSSTPMHSDCCDNFAMMIAGTKRWTIAPPSEARLIKPKCNGGLCWGKKLEHPDEHAYTQRMKDLRDQTQLITFDLKPGEMLYLPCGWFHHVENVGPTIMVNFWTKEKPFFLQKVDGEL